MPSNKSASANPVGSCTPFSFEQASQRFTFCILPSRIWVRKTVASLHLQTSHNIAVELDLETFETFNAQLVEHLLRRVDSRALLKDRRAGFPRHFAETADHVRRGRTGLTAGNRACVRLRER